MNRLRAGLRAAVVGDGAALRDPAPQRDARRRVLERGQTVEAVIIYPLILGVIFVMIQAGIWVYARSAALSAAHEGALAAASYRSDASGAGTAQSVLGESSTGLFHDVSASESRSAESVSVTVRGRALSLVPLVELPPIEQTSTVPVERYVPAEGGAPAGGGGPPPEVR